MVNAMSLDEALHNGQRKPPEWDGLVEIAANSLREGLPYSDQQFAAQQVWEAAYDLPVEDFEANRYYGHGLVVCSFAQSLASPRAERRLVKTAATRLTEPVRTGFGIARAVSDPNLTVSDINVGDGLVPASQGLKEYKALPPEQRLVINTLQVAKPTSVNNRSWWHNVVISEVLRDKEARKPVLFNSFVGACALMRGALVLLHQQNTGKEISADDEETLYVKDIADEATIASFNLVKPAARAASLRLDEFGLNLRRLLEINEAGEFDVDPQKIPKDPGLLPRPKGLGGQFVIHEQRRGCPALYVSDAVPLVARSMPKIVNLAQRQLSPQPSRWDRLLGYLSQPFQKTSS